MTDDFTLGYTSAIKDAAALSFRGLRENAVADCVKDAIRNNILAITPPDTEAAMRRAVEARIKPLVWERDEGAATAEAMSGHYVANGYCGRLELIIGWPRSGMIVIWRHDAPRASAEDLILAAQADYTRRILAALGWEDGE